MRKEDPNGEVLVCRKCSGYARCRLGPKQMNHCKPEKTDTQELGRWKRLLILEERRVPDRNATGWKVEGGKKKSHQECKMLRELKLEIFMTQKELWNIAKKTMLEERGVVPKED